MSTWREIEEASLHCMALRLAVEMVHQGMPKVEALAGAALYLSRQNKRFIDAEVDRLMREPAVREAFWRDIGRPADGHLGAVGGE